MPYNAHKERQRRKERRKRRGRPRAQKIEKAEGFGGTPSAEDLVNAAAAFACRELHIDPDQINGIRWGGTAEEMDAWGEFLHDKGTIRLASNHPTRLALVETTMHELAHVAQRYIGRFRHPAVLTRPELEKAESEADAVAAGLVREFLDAADLDVSALDKPYSAQ